jgi:RNA polymerase sigma factor (sigma-70 family)
VLGEAFPDVLAAAQAGAPWAFERLYAELAPVVTGYLRLHGAFEPDDLASETFLGVFTGLASFLGGEQGFRSWVFTIAHRRLLDERRRLARRGAVVRVDAELPDRPGGDVEDEALGAVGEQRVHELCASLLPAQRAVLLLRIVADLTVEQVAHVLGKSVPAVKALQRRGLRALREQLERDRAPLERVPAITGTR